MSSGPASDSSTDELAGFAIQRRLGERTWLAVQPQLERRVALRRLDPGETFDATAWPHRAGVVGLFAVVERPEGTYVATRYVAGARTLAELGRARASRRRRWLAEAAAALDGTVHGHLTAQDILVGGDGRALVTGFGRAAPDASADDDRVVLDALHPPPPRGRPRPALGAAVVVLAAGAAFALRGDGDPPAPPVPTGAVAHGSAVAPGDYVTVDCDGDRPSGNSLPCTIMQSALPGRRLVAERRGVVRSWVVRGVRGRVALQVLRVAGGRYVAYNRSRAVTIEDPGVATAVPADLSVPPGARFGLEIAAGSGAGLRTGVRGAAARRFYGRLRSEPQAPDPGVGAREELLLRVDVVPEG